MQGIVNEMDKSEKSKIKDKTNAMRIIESKSSNTSCLPVRVRRQRARTR